MVANLCERCFSAYSRYAGIDDVSRMISETPKSLLSITTRAIVGIATTIVVYRFCVLPGKFLLFSSCPESVRLLTDFYLRVNVALRWLGHVHRMEDGRLPKDILYSEFYNAPRRTGRPKLRYKDVIKRGMAGFQSLHIHGKHFLPIAADGVPLSFGYSLSGTSYAKKWRSAELIVDDGMGHDDNGDTMIIMRP